MSDLAPNSPRGISRTTLWLLLFAVEFVSLFVLALWSRKLGVKGGAKPMLTGLAVFVFVFSVFLLGAYLKIRSHQRYRERALRIGLSFICAGVLWILASVTIVSLGTDSMTLGILSILGFLSWTPLIGLGIALILASDPDAPTKPPLP